MRVGTVTREMLRCAEPSRRSSTGVAPCRRYKLETEADLPDRHRAGCWNSALTVLTPFPQRNKLRPGRDFRLVAVLPVQLIAPRERGLRSGGLCGISGGMGEVHRQKLPVCWLRGESPFAPRKDVLSRSERQHSLPRPIFSSDRVPPRSAVHAAFRIRETPWTSLIKSASSSTE